MEFADAVTFFQTDPVYDAYTGALLFYGQTVPHTTNAPGSVSRQRTIETSPDTVAPPRRVVSWYGDPWIIGNDNFDAFAGSVIKRSFDMKRATDLLELVTPAQACLGSAGTQLYVHKEYNGDRTDPLSSYEYDTMWAVYCPLNEQVARGAFLRLGSTLLHVRNAYRTHEDFLLAESDQLDDDAIQSITFTQNGALDLRADRLATVSTIVQAVQTDTQKFYRYRNQVEYGVKSGDRTVFVAKSSITPSAGATFTMLGASWRVLAAVPEQDAWAIHARPA